MRHKTLTSIMNEAAKRQVKQKAVRIDDKTVIFVARNISDDEARNEYLLKIEENRRKFDNRQQQEKWS